MKFLIDAQLPPVLKFVFHARGFHAIHTLDLPEANDTKDIDICALAIKENYVVVTKDKDFYNSFLLKQQPQKLVLVRTGNIRIKDLKRLFDKNFDILITSLTHKNLVIIGLDYINAEQ